MTGTDGSLPDACTAALTNGAKWGIFLKAPVEGIEKGILWDTGAAMIWSGIEVVITGLIEIDSVGRSPISANP